LHKGTDPNVLTTQILLTIGSGDFGIVGGGGKFHIFPLVALSFEHSGTTVPACDDIITVYAYSLLSIFHWSVNVYHLYQNKDMADWFLGLVRSECKLTIN